MNRSEVDTRVKVIVRQKRVETALKHDDLQKQRSSLIIMNNIFIPDLRNVLYIYIYIYRDVGSLYTLA
jgi:hypothetical protein